MDEIFVPEKMDKETLDYVFNMLDNRINTFQRDLKKLKDLENDSDLNPMAINDIAFVIDLSMNALLQFKKELQTDIDEKEIWVE